MQEELNKIKAEIFKELKNIKKEGEKISATIVNDLEIKILGRKGELSKILRGIKDLGQEKRKEFGKFANNIKQEITEEFQNVKTMLNFQKNEKKNFFDITLQGDYVNKGSLNPITLVQNDLENLFSTLGFMIVDGPELESDYFCFETMNIPKHHPARDMQDTFYVETDKLDLVMRPHTSSMEVRAMKVYGAPLRCVIPGRVFRNEATDACHEHTFNQIEGLMIDKNISISNFKAIIQEMISGIFNADVKTRLRPGYFPYVEPGFELDMSCTICNDSKNGCPTCKHSGWLELGGAGMVHPHVLKAGNIDPDKFSGFAFGFGLERLAMMRYGINDIRLFNSGNLKFLEQFR